jgi:hypothetical protein
VVIVITDVMIMSQQSMDIIKVEPTSDEETPSVPSQSGYQLIDKKHEDILELKTEGMVSCF